MSFWQHRLKDAVRTNRRHTHINYALRGNAKGTCIAGFRSNRSENGAVFSKAGGDEIAAKDRIVPRHEAHDTVAATSELIEEDWQHVHCTLVDVVEEDDATATGFEAA